MYILQVKIKNILKNCFRKIVFLIRKVYMANGKIKMTYCMKYIK